MALLKFICCNLKKSYNDWPAILKPHLQCGNITKLQLVLRHVMLRRIKKLALTNLPQITHHIFSIPLTSSSQKYYDECFTVFLNSLKSTKSSEKRTEKGFFAHLQNLRGVCDHPLLADPLLNLGGNGEFKSQQVPNQNTSNESNVTINHQVSYKVCCQSHKIMKICEMI